MHTYPHWNALNLKKLRKNVLLQRGSDVSDASDVRLSYLPPMPMLIDNLDKSDEDEDFSSILRKMELLEEEINQELDK